jgi:tetratricopeptide (TPR) repeat protein
LGDVYAAKDELDNAIRSYNQAIRRLSPKDTDAYYEAYYDRALAYKRKGLDSLAITDYDTAIRALLTPGVTIRFPANADYETLQSVRGFQFAAPAIPDLTILQECRTSASDQSSFYSCMVHQALPKEYRVTEDCTSANPDDHVAALICSSGKTDLSKGYDEFNKIQKCVGDDPQKSDTDIAACIGESHLGPNEQYYLECVKQNPDSYAGMAVCALAKDLTPEQQIALSCAAESDGDPVVYAGCVGGELTERELEKCWDGGIATSDGCFGPNRLKREQIVRRRVQLGRQREPLRPARCPDIRCIDKRIDQRLQLVHARAQHPFERGPLQRT